jgi:hypothetical protein
MEPAVGNPTQTSVPGPMRTTLTKRRTHTKLLQVVGGAIVRSLAATAADDRMRTAIGDVHDLLDRVLALHEVDKVLATDFVADGLFVVARVDADDSIAQSLGVGAAHGSHSTTSTQHNDPYDALAELVLTRAAHIVRVSR